MKRWICLAVMAMMLMSGCASSGTASEEGSTATEGAAAQTDGTQEETADAVDEQTQKYIDHLLMEAEAMPQLDAPREGDQVATITTNYGDIQIKLCPDQAPKAAVRAAGAASLKMNLILSCIISAAHCRWPIAVQIPMAVNFLLSKTLPYKRDILTLSIRCGNSMAMTTCFIITRPENSCAQTIPKQCGKNMKRWAAIRI